MKKPLLSIIFFVMISGLTSYSQDPLNESFFRRKVIFEPSKDDDYYTYRIPSLVCTKNGTLLAFAAARKNQGGDWDPIDIVLKRSTDYGETWSSMKLIAGGGKIPYDNATPIVDNQTGIVHLLYQSNYEKCYYTFSKDDGKSFEKPVEITKTVEGYKNFYNWIVMAPGPGHGIKTSSGRLVVPFWLSDGSSKEFGPDKRGHRPSIVVSVYSDDDGKTWNRGDVVAENSDEIIVPNETSVIELADGRIMFNIRNESTNFRRLVSFSKDGATGWTPPEYADAFFEPICFASMVRYSKKPSNKKNRILFCNPDSRKTHVSAKVGHTKLSARARIRSNLTIRMSYDEGISWPVKKEIDSGISGYSDLAVTPDGMIHCFYEGGTLTGSHYKNAWMSISSFNIEWLTNGLDFSEKVYLNK